MSEKRSSDKGRSILKSILYYLTVLILIAVLALMYMNWRNKQSQFVAMRKQAAQNEVVIELEAR